MPGRKRAALAAALATVLLLLAGCGSKAPGVDAFAVGTTVNGMDISGMTPAQVSDAMGERLESYRFTLSFGEEQYEFSAGELYLQCREDLDFQVLLEEQKQSGRLEFTLEGFYTADLTGLQESLADVGADSGQAKAKNATLTYDAEAQSFVVVPEQYGWKLDTAAVAQACLPAVLELERELALTLEDYGAQPTVTADSPELLAALEEANRALALELTYTFTPEGESTSSLTLSRSTLARLYYVDESLALQVDEQSVGELVQGMVDEYAGAAKSSQFRTSLGSYINVRTSRAGQSVDGPALYEDLMSCLKQRVGGTRRAPYLALEDSDEEFWGGSYAEVDLTGQQMWLYKNGECILHCDVVSGCVYDGTTTTTGVFQIFSKQKDRYLNGYNVDGTKYHTWVNYFLPFNGGIAFHDATWRSEFGGTCYYYDGSHGCVGVSLSNAKTIYDNVNVGTYVVVYGGLSKSELPGRSQEITLSAETTTLAVGGRTQLNVTGAQTTPLYESDNREVAVVDGFGNIRALSPGTANITVTCPAGKGYEECSGVITITVTGESAPGEHVHWWKEVVETITHEAVYEQQQVTTTREVTLWVCDGCQAEFESQTEAEAHAAEAGATVTEKTVTREVTETVDVLVQEPWTEEVTRTVCAECGEEKTE